MSSTSIGTSYNSGSGIDVTGTVDQILYSERAPERLWQTQQDKISLQSQALQSIQSQLAALQTAVNGLKDFTGSLSAVTASSSNSSVVTGTASSSATNGTHTIVVSQTATTSTVYSDALPSNTTFSDGVFQFTVGGEQRQITIDSHCNTLSTLASAINAGNYGVTANVVNDASGQRLALVSKSSGLPGAIAVSGTLGAAAFHEGIAARNAQLEVDGVPIESASNTVAEVLPGITIQALQDAPGSPVTITVGADTAKAKQAITAFVTSFNSIVKSINTQFATTSSGSSAPLAGDSGLRTVQSVLLAQIGTQFSGNGALTTLKSVGIDMNDDGTLTVNDTTLDRNLQSSPAQVRSFFQDGESGFATTLSATLLDLASTTEGALSVEINGLSQQNQTLSDQIDAFETRLEQRRKTLINEYSQIDATLRQMPLLLQQITSQLGTKNN